MVQREPTGIYSIENMIKFPFKGKACQVYREGYGRGGIW